METGKIVPYDGGDVVYEHKWKLKCDSVINVAGLDYKIIKLTDDTLTINSDTNYNILGTKDNIIMVWTKEKISIR